MDELEQISNKFNDIVFSLSKEDIYEFDKTNNGPLHNVIPPLPHESFRVVSIAEKVL